MARLFGSSNCRVIGLGTYCIHSVSRVSATQRLVPGSLPFWRRHSDSITVGVRGGQYVGGGALAQHHLTQCPSAEFPLQTPHSARPIVHQMSNTTVPHWSLDTSFPWAAPDWALFLCEPTEGRADHRCLRPPRRCWVAPLLGPGPLHEMDDEAQLLEVVHPHGAG